MALKNTKRLKSICFATLSLILGVVALVIEGVALPDPQYPSVYGLFTLLSWFTAIAIGVLAIIIGRSVKFKTGIIAGRIGVGFSAFFFIISIIGFMLTISTDRVPCQLEMQHLSKAIQQYCKQNEDSLPDAGTWCDQALESVEYPKNFQITGGHDHIYNTPVIKKSNFAFNNNLDGYQLADIDRQTVLLFETDPSWNQNGGSDILLPEGHPGYRAFLKGGAHFVFVGPDSTFTVKFIKNSDIDSLNWEK